MGLAVLSPIPHLIVLHTAHRWPEAKVLLDFRYQARSLRKLNLVYEDAVAVALLAYRHHARARYAFREQFNTNPAPTLFSTFLMELVAARLGIDLNESAHEPASGSAPPLLNGTAVH